MKAFRIALFSAVILALTFFAFAQQKPAQQEPASAPTTQAAEKHQHPPMKPHPEFDRLKQLVGRWEGTSPYGPAVTEYRLTADGSALMSFLAPGTKDEMLTVFHPDGPNVMGTHYCSGHNQPRFVATPSTDPKVMTFKFKDVTNLDSPNGDHIQGLIITFTDANHHTEEWTSLFGGKVATLKMDFVRKD